MGTWWVITGVVLVLVVAGALLAPVPKRWVERAASLTFWRRESVRQRLRRRRPLLLGYAGLAALAAIVLVVWMLPAVLTENPTISSSADRHQAITNTRTGLVAMLAAIGAAGGLAFTARTYRLSREGHITDRYSKAVEQLGDEKIEVRLGGIYALERLMRDSRADQPTIMETLAAFVRQHAPLNSRPALPGRGAPRSGPDRPAEDVQTVLTVLGRRDPVDRERPLDLRHADLTSADLTGANLTAANLNKANLTRANLHGGNLTAANLNKADLTRADLSGATLTRAHLSGANLTAAQLGSADLTAAFLNKADLTGAGLGSATLTRAFLIGATLCDADLSRRT